MSEREVLKSSRDLLLKLHKVMLDAERERHEAFFGPVSPTEYLNLLLEDPAFAWLRKFSMLIVEIDEMFAQKDGFPGEMVTANLQKVRELVEMEEDDEAFRSKYQYVIQASSEAASLHSELKQLVGG